MMGPRTFLAVSGLAIVAVCWATGFAVHGLPGDDWLNWKGWGWIASPINMAIGICYGWTIRGQYERSRRFREEVAAWRAERERRAREDVH